MRLLCLLFIVTFGGCARLCRGYLDDYRVSRGVEVNLFSVPYHAGIYKVPEGHRQICGGTIVAADAVITAAHCFSQGRDMPSPSDYAVAAGKLHRKWNDDRDKGAQKSLVKDIKIPPHYQGSVTNFQDDLAVVILVSHFNFSFVVAPINLSFDPDFDRAQLREGQRGKVVGWGLTGQNSGPSEVLQGAALAFIAIDKCIEQSPVGFRSLLTGDKFCAGYTNGTAVCRGDSGGGLVFASVKDNRLVRILRGVVSTSPTSNDECNIYTWATFTSLLKHEHFLKSALPGLVEEATTSPNTLAKSPLGGTIQLTERFMPDGCECIVCSDDP